MDEKTKDRWVYPLLTGAIASVVTGVPLIIWGAWYSGVKWHSPFSTNWLKLVFAAPVPVWFALPISIVAVFATWKAFQYSRRNSLLEERQRGSSHWQTLAEALGQEKEALEFKIQYMKNEEPKLHGVWNQAQALWHMGRHGSDPAMQIGGWIDLSSSNTDDSIFLLAAYIDEHRAQIFIDVEVKPNVVNHSMVMLFFYPPLAREEDKAYDATIVLEDQFNRKYELPRQTFRATPGQTPPPIPIRAPAAQLTLTWRIAGWCWTLHNGERVFRISGDGPIQLDNAPDKVLFTGVRIEGAEFVGIFDNFELEPGKRGFRGFNLDFKGINSEGKVPVKLKLMFVDFKGNFYPTKEVTFNPIDEPKQFGGLPWS